MERVQSELDWTTSQHPTPMLELLRRGKFSFRKMRFLMCAFARLMPDDTVGEDDQQAILVSERYADKEITHIELERIRAFQGSRSRGYQWSHPLVCANKLLVVSCQRVLGAATRARINTWAERPDWEEFKELRHAYLARARPGFATIVRDVFSNPFRSMTVDPHWLTETTVALATGIYADRAFDRMPILADALEDAGCDNFDILTHCRGDGPHVRGCWVVDLVLGKE
ncbi:MAG: hypothetical protein ACOVP8_02670 [Phycisphaerales bacterium]